MLTAERLRELLHYDALTGVFTWRVNRGRNPCAGKQAGRTKATGYREIRVDGRGYLAHRLAFLYVLGSLPADLVDHRNGVPGDNSWQNLRHADHSLNQQNQRSGHQDSNHGFLGATFNHQKRRWVARILHNQRRVFLGYFSTPEAAHEAYLKAKRVLHPGGTL